MEVLLDTPIFLWCDTRSTRLGQAATGVIAAPVNRVFVIAASIREIAIKRRLVRLT